MPSHALLSLGYADVHALLAPYLSSTVLYMHVNVHIMVSTFTLAISPRTIQNPEDHELKPESMDVQISPTHQSFASPASPLTTRVSHMTNMVPAYTRGCKLLHVLVHNYVYQSTVYLRDNCTLWFR